MGLKPYSKVETLPTRQVNYIEWYYNNGNPLPLPSVEVILHPNSRIVLDQSISTVNTPFFKQLVLSKQLLPQHPFSLNRRQVQGGRVMRSISRNGYYQTTTTFYYPACDRSVDDLNWSPDWTEVQNKLLKRLKGAKWEAPVAIAEARKTSKLITDTAYRLAAVVRDLRRGSLGSASSLLGLAPPSASKMKAFRAQFGQDPRHAAGSAWLELQYGWKPLLKDIHDAAEALALNYNRPSNRISKVTAKSNEKTQWSEYRRFSETPPQGCNVVYELSANYRMIVLFEQDSNVKAVQTVGLTNPLTVAWELVPYSFVVDWFLPIGDYLNQLDARLGKAFKGGTRSVSLSAKQLWLAPFYQESLPASSQSSSGSYIWTRKAKYREILTDFPEFGVPAFDPKLGLARSASALALLQTQLSRLARKPRS